MPQSTENSPTELPTATGLVPSLYMDQNDHTYLLMLIFAAHPNLHLDHLAMAHASFRMPDPRMWTSLVEIQRRLEPLQRLGCMLRELPSSRNYDPELDAPAVRRRMTQQQWLRAKERRAWQTFLNLPNNFTSSPAEMQPPPIQSVFSNDDNSSPTADEGLDEDDNYSSGSGVWIVGSPTISESGSLDEEWTFERREHRPAQWGESNAAIPYDAREPEGIELETQRLDGTASQLDVGNHNTAGFQSPASLDIEEESDLFLRLSLDGSA